MSRRKGSIWELEVAKMFREIGIEARRGIQRSGIPGALAPDVDAAPFWVECKHGTVCSANPTAAMRQVLADCPKGRIPVAITKVNRRTPLVTMTLEDWLELVTEAKETWKR